MIGQQRAAQQVTEFTDTVMLDCDMDHTLTDREPLLADAFPLTVPGR